MWLETYTIEHIIERDEMTSSRAVPMIELSWSFGCSMLDGSSG
jgi:hypothetical protein